MPTQVDSFTDPDRSSESNLGEPCLADITSSRLLSPNQIQRLSPAALAYLGDAVFELYIRRCYLFPPQRIQTYHQQVVAQVRAEAQSAHLQTLIPHLTPVELEWLKRGRNAVTNRSRRVDADTYQQATSLETLIGYLYLTDLQRLMQLFDLLNIAPAPAD